MARVEFEENLYLKSFSKSRKPRPSFLIGLLIKIGIAKTINGAQTILLFVFIVSTALTFYVIYRGFVLPKQNITYYEDLSASERAQIDPDVLNSLPRRK